MLTILGTIIACTVALVAIVAVALALSGSASPKSAPSPPQFSEAQVAQAKAVIQGAKNDDVIGKIDETSERVWVDPLLWNALSIDVKRGLAFSCRIYFADNGGRGEAWIYDYRNDQLLAWVSTDGQFTLK